MPIPDVTFDIRWPTDVCARCGQERSAHGQYENEACGNFVKAAMSDDALLAKAHEEHRLLGTMGALRVIETEARERERAAGDGPGTDFFRRCMLRERALWALYCERYPEQPPAENPGG